MAQQVMIEIDEPALRLADDVKKLSDILGNAYEVDIEQGQLIVTVQESDDPVQEVTEKLDEAGVRCICYEWDAAQHAAAMLPSQAEVDEHKSSPMTPNEVAAEIVSFLNTKHSDERICSATANGRLVIVNFFDQKAMHIEIKEGT